MSVETFEFKSESQQVLNLMIHSLYSNKEIFLRELISNASDALDKLRFESLTKSELLGTDLLKIQLSANSEERTLTIADNGIGMNKDELIKNLGTIAHSGTKAFLDQIKTEKQSKEAVSQLIGQFGVGFYSSFIVADKVEVSSRKAGTTEAFKWTSTGDGKFSIEQTQKEKAGTSIVLYLKEININASAEDAEAGLDEDFTREHVIEKIIKKYSDFVQYPIELQVTRWVDAAGNESEYEEHDEDEDAYDADDAEPKENKEPKAKKVQTISWKQLNSMKAIWARDPKDVSDEEYETFYKHVSKNHDQPLEKIRHKAEGGSFDYTYLIFLPSESNHSLYYRDQKHGLQLYVNRVMIMENCEDLIPEYFRFVKGVVESPDLSLNVSREILQQDKKLKIIRNRIVKKLMDTLEDLQTKDRNKYEQFWEKFGNVVKEGVIDFEHAERLKNLFLFKSSTQEGYTTLKEYIGRMKDGQKEIYYITSENLDTAKRSPHIEAFNDKGIEVLYMVDQVDEWMMNSFYKFDDKDMKSIGKGQVELGSEEEKKAKKEEIKEKEENLKDLLSAIKDQLATHVKEVRLSSRLTNSPSCLVVGEYDQSVAFEEMLRKMGQSMPTGTKKRIFELNPNHPLVEKLNQSFKQDPKDPKIGQYSQLLFGQAQLAEGTQLSEPQLFSQALTALMIN